MCRVHGRGEWAYGEREDVPCPRGEGVKRIDCNLSKGGGRQKVMLFGKRGMKDSVPYSRGEVRKREGRE